MYNERNNPLERIRHLQRLLSLLESIFRSSAAGQVFMYLLEHGAATAWLVQVDLEMPEASAYRSLKRLRALKLLLPAIKLSNISVDDKGGPRATIWMLPGTSSEQVAIASRRHYRALSPKYQLAVDVAREILDTYSRKPTWQNEISMASVFLEVKAQGITFSARDIAELTAQELAEQGVRVWR